MFTCCEAELKPIFLKVRLETFIFYIDKVTPALTPACTAKAIVLFFFLFVIIS